MNTNTTVIAASAAQTKNPAGYRPSLALYHPNGKGTGSAVKFELHPAHDDHDGSIMMCIANQMTIGDRRGPSPVFPTFDWEGRIVVKLDFADLAKMLQVFRGECETLEDGRGLYHRTARFTTRIVLRHLIEPVCCYSLEVYRSTLRGDEEVKARILLASHEALGLCESISGSLAVIAFGIPMVVRRDAASYEAEKRGGRNVVAS